LIWNRTEIEPRFYEIDSYGIVNHMFYISWCELARLKISKDAGLLIPKLYDEVIMFVVSNIQMNYIHAINFWENSIIIESVISEVKASKLIFKHRIKSGKTKIEMAYGESSIVCLRSGKMLLSFPGWISERIDNYIKNIQKGISLE